MDWGRDGDVIVYHSAILKLPVNMVLLLIVQTKTVLVLVEFVGLKCGVLIMVRSLLAVTVVLKWLLVVLFVVRICRLFV